MWVGLWNHMCVLIYIVFRNMHTSINIHIYTYIQCTYTYTYVYICYLVASREKWTAKLDFTILPFLCLSLSFLRLSRPHNREALVLQELLETNVMKSPVGAHGASVCHWGITRLLADWGTVGSLPQPGLYSTASLITGKTYPGTESFEQSNPA